MTIETSAATIAAISGAITTVIGVLVTGIVSIIRTLHETRSVVVAGQAAGAAASVVRDKKLDNIHVLVNSRLVNVLRTMVVLTKREADRTGAPEDLAAYQTSQAELSAAEAAATATPTLVGEDLQTHERAADEAAQKLLALTTKQR